MFGGNLLNQQTIAVKESSKQDPVSSTQHHYSADPTHTHLVHHRKKINVNAVIPAVSEIEMKSGINGQS